MRHDQAARMMMNDLRSGWAASDLEDQSRTDRKVHFTRRLGTTSSCCNPQTGGGGGVHAVVRACWWNWDTLLHVLFVFPLRLPKEKIIVCCEISTLSVVCVPLAGNYWLPPLRYETGTRSRSTAD